MARYPEKISLDIEGVKEYCNQGLGKYILYIALEQDKKMFFEMRDFKEYVLFNDKRKCIIEKIKERGSVYGNEIKTSKT